ncbi:MAG: enoyl-CoA hydratase-related protein [Planctomycetota bacterium]
MSEYKNLLVELKDGWVELTINRPDKLNALNDETIGELHCFFEWAKHDDATRAVLVTGAGEKAFVAGADISELAKMTALDAERSSRKGQAAFDAIEHLGKPVVAAINGFALGGGCELALACTFRTASENAQMGLPEVGLGILPGYGGTQRLPRIVGRGIAAEMVLTGQRIPASEAHRIGLVNHVFTAEELIPKTREIVSKILRNGPIAIRMAQEAVVHGSEMTQADGLRYEATLFGLISASEDMHEGMKAFLEKRKPNFQGR